MSKRGGARPGTGPKPTGRRKVNVYVTELEELMIRDMLIRLRDGQVFTSNQLQEQAEIVHEWRHEEGT